MANPIKKALDKAFKPILKPILDIYKAFLCIVRIAGNIKKCWYWYLLTILKYIILLIFIYIPLLIVVLLLSLIYKPKSAIKNLKKTVSVVETFTQWPADVQYRCFKCKKPKKKKFNFFKKVGKSLRKFFAKKNWNFYKITLFIIIMYFLFKVIEYYGIFSYYNLLKYGISNTFLTLLLVIFIFIIMISFWLVKFQKDKLIRKVITGILAAVWIIVLVVLYLYRNRFINKTVNELYTTETNVKGKAQENIVNATTGAFNKFNFI
jgi:hypothetical protein